MQNLTQQWIRDGIQNFYNHEPQPKCVVEVVEYTGEKELVINCTQLDDYMYPQYAKAREKKRVLSEWCEFLTENPEAFTILSFGTRMPQELFNAVCKQKNLKSLYIKWGVYPDISAIAGLQKLEYLHIGSGAGVLSIDPLAQLKNLVVLSVENFQKIMDYRPLTALENLELLSIEGNALSPKYIHIDSLDFLRDMKQLRAFYLMVARVASKDYTPILKLENLESLWLAPCKEVKAIYNRLLELPKLKYGSLFEHPEFYR